MATTATCTRFTDEYQLYEELGKYGACCAPRAAPCRPPRPRDPPALPGALCRRPGSPGSRRRISCRPVILFSSPPSTPAAQPPEGKVLLPSWVAPPQRVSLQPVSGCALLLHPQISSLPSFPSSGPGCPVLLPAPSPSYTCRSLQLFLRWDATLLQPLRDASVPTSLSL